MIVRTGYHTPGWSNAPIPVFQIDRDQAPLGYLGVTPSMVEFLLEQVATSDGMHAELVELREHLKGEAWQRMASR